MRAPVRKGEVLAGKYRVERVLGEGGMGVVVAARHLDLDELVALKFLLPAAALDPDANTRFLREARATVKIKNEHVARVTDVGQLASGAPYLVMEYLDGRDLAVLLRDEKRLKVEDAVDYVLQACEALAEAHALGIVHRDLKPSNLMLVKRSDGSPCVKLLDFGISKVTTPDGAMNITRTATVLGSPLYMSPEQVLSARNVDSRTDIWALGTILYELLAGTPAFFAETLPKVGALIATGEPTPLREACPEVPAGVEEIVAACLHKKREGRPASVAKLAELLRPYAPGRSRVSLERIAGLSGGVYVGGSTVDAPPWSEAIRVGVAGVTASQWSRSAATARGRRTRLALIAAGLVLLASGGALVGVRVLARPGAAAGSAPSQGSSPGEPPTPPVAASPPASARATAPASTPAGPSSAAPPAANAAASADAGASPPPPHPSAAPTRSPGPSAPPAPAHVKKRSPYEDM